MSRSSILYPVFAMIGLVAFAVGHLARVRFRALRGRDVPLTYFKDFRGLEAPERVVVAARHVANLFEGPVLFYLVCVLSYVTGQVGVVMVALAWLYVLSRYVHSFVHLTSNDVGMRFRAFLGSCLVLLSMWVILAIELVHSEIAAG